MEKLVPRIVEIDRRGKDGQIEFLVLDENDNEIGEAITINVFMQYSGLQTFTSHAPFIMDQRLRKRVIDRKKVEKLEFYFLLGDIYKFRSFELFIQETYTGSVELTGLQQDKGLEPKEYMDLIIKSKYIINTFIRSR